MKYLWSILGCVCLIIGVIGSILPLVPAIPFFLMAILLFAKSSKKVHNWLIRHKLYNTIIKKFNIEKHASLYAKAGAITLLWAIFLCIMFLVIPPIIWMQAALIIVTIAITILIYRYKNNSSKETKDE